MVGIAKVNFKLDYGGYVILEHLRKIDMEQSVNGLEGHMVAVKINDFITDAYVYYVEFYNGYYLFQNIQDGGTPQDNRHLEIGYKYSWYVGQGSESELKVCGVELIRVYNSDIFYDVDLDVMDLDEEVKPKPKPKSKPKPSKTKSDKINISKSDFNVKVKPQVDVKIRI